MILDKSEFLSVQFISRGVIKIKKCVELVVMKKFTLMIVGMLLAVLVAPVKPAFSQTSETPILINSQTRLSSLYVEPHFDITQYDQMTELPWLWPYLWMTSFEIDGIRNKFVVSRSGRRYIGRFQKPEDLDPQDIHVFTRPNPFTEVTAETFGRRNIVAAMQPGDTIDLLSRPFLRHRFGDLVPIRYEVSDFNIEGYAPAILGYVVVLWGRKDSPQNAVLAGAKEFVLAVREEIDKLIENYEYDMTDYINSLDYSQPPPIEFSKEQIAALSANVQQRVRAAIETNFELDAADWFFILTGGDPADIVDEVLGVAVSIVPTNSLMENPVGESSSGRQALRETFETGWDATAYATVFRTVGGTSRREYVEEQVTWRLTGTIEAEKLEPISGKKMKWCFIATAGYGSQFAPEVQVLRKFRDRYLISNSLGRYLVALYYEISPSVADIIAKHDTLRAVVRWSLLPMLGVSWMALKLGPIPAMAMVFLMFTLMCATVVVVSRKILPRGKRT